MKRLLSTLFSAFVLCGCATQDPCTYTRDIAGSPSGLVLTAGEHGAGWGRTECFQCHPDFRVHQNDCSAIANVDAAAIEALIDPADTTTCIQCHGTNGVAAWYGLDDSGDTQ